MILLIYYFVLHSFSLYCPEKTLFFQKTQNINSIGGEAALEDFSL